MMQRASIGQLQYATPEAVSNTAITTESPKCFWSNLSSPRSYEDHLWNIARDCLENIGFLRSQRKPLSHENWRAPAKAEQRLLNQVDAILACGQHSIEKAIQYIHESEIPDPEWAFAVLLVLGSISDNEALQSAISLFEMLAERDSEEGRAAADALFHSKNPGIQSALEPLLVHGPEQWKRLAAGLLCRRGELSASQIESLLTSQDPQLIAIALEAQTDLYLWRRDIDRFILHDSDVVAYAAFRLCYTRKYDAGRKRALELIKQGDTTLGDPVFWIGLAGDERDWPLLESLLSGPDAKRAAAALGYWGYPKAVPALLRAFSATLGERRAVFAFALERITGAGLSAWNVESQELMLAEPDAYEEWLNRHAPVLASASRLRRGLPFGPAALLHELEGGAHTQMERTIAHTELMSLYDGACPLFRAEAFISVQETAILEWKRLWSIT